MQNAELAYISASQRGESDGLLARVAATLGPRKTLRGVVQINTEYDPDRPCHMDLAVLGTSEIVRISQFLGAGSKGCRLDAAGLEKAVGMVTASLAQTRPDLLILNKYGKHECDGRGFRPLIGQALSMGVPVLTAVSPLNLPRFLDFAEGMAVALPSDPGEIIGWAERRGPG